MRQEESMYSQSSLGISGKADKLFIMFLSLLICFSGFIFLSIIHHNHMLSRGRLLKAQSYIANIIDSMPSVLVGVDSNGIVTQWNSAAQLATGVLAENAVEQPLSQVFPRLTKEMERVYEAMRTRQVQTDNRYTRNEGGQVCHEVVSVFPLVSGADGAEGAVIRVDDVTERMEVDEELRREKLFSEAAIASLPGIFYVYDVNGKFLRWNHNLETVSGYLAEEIAQMHPDGLFPQDERAYVNEAIKEVFEKGWASVEANFMSKDKSTRAYCLTGARFEADGVPCIVGVGFDIEDRKRVESERERLIQELENKNTELERYGYTVSHDLKSPLVTISGFVNMLEEDALAGDFDKVKVDLQYINSAIKKMSQLLSGLLELSRLGRMINPSEDIPLFGLTNEVLELFVFTIEEKNVRVNVSSELPVVFGDRHRVSEVMQNLIENAIKYMGSQPNPQIDIGVRQEARENVIFVRDNGVGINPKYCDNVFGLFNQLNPAEDGTGVGLAIVKRIVELHGGGIWVESEGEGKGSTFCFTLSRDGGAESQAD